MVNVAINQPMLLLVGVIIINGYRALNSPLPLPEPGLQFHKNARR
ncbi:MAG: hypothetical protein JWO03_592 [Bacteroidetes bacterium]|nr:hypothetical protein [Bacteroidota bacterium]